MSFRNSLLCDDGFVSNSDGFRVRVRLPRYRSLPVSCIKPVSLRVDNEEISLEHIRFHVNNRDYEINELAYQHDDWWFVGDAAELRVVKPGGIAPGQHQVSVELSLRIPYNFVDGKSEAQYDVQSITKTLTCVRREVDQSALKKPRLGVSLYSFTPEFQSGRTTLSDLIARVAQHDLGSGLELVGFGHIRNFPHISAEFEADFKNLVEKYELELSCLGTNVDMAIRTDRLLSQEETIEYMAAQIIATGKLGFPVARVQYQLSPEMLERLLPVAEKANVKMGVEIHSPHSVNHPTMQRLLELFNKRKSPYLGFIPDFGASTTGVPEVFLDGFRRRGVPEDLIQMILNIWAETKDISRGGDVDPVEFRKVLRDKVEKMGGSNYAKQFAMGVPMYFGRQSAKLWADVIPHIVHIHGKFFGIDDNGIDPVIDHEQIISDLRDGGYTGHISSEYEGWVWDENPQGMADPIKMVQGHQQMLRRILG